MPDDAAQAAAQPDSRKLKRYLCTVGEKWWFNQLTQREPDLALSAYISKFNAQYPILCASLTTLDWIQRDSIDKLKKLYALNVGKSVRDKYVHSRPVKCEKLEIVLFHWLHGQEDMDSCLKQCLRLLFMFCLLFLPRAPH